MGGSRPCEGGGDGGGCGGGGRQERTRWGREIDARKRTLTASRVTPTREEQSSVPSCHDAQRANVQVHRTLARGARRLCTELCGASCPSPPIRRKHVHAPPRRTYQRPPAPRSRPYRRHHHANAHRRPSAGRHTTPPRDAQQRLPFAELRHRSNVAPAAKRRPPQPHPRHRRPSAAAGGRRLLHSVGGGGGGRAPQVTVACPRGGTASPLPSPAVSTAPPRARGTTRWQRHGARRRRQRRIDPLDAHGGGRGGRGGCQPTVGGGGRGRAVGRAVPEMGNFRADMRGLPVQAEGTKMAIRSAPSGGARCRNDGTAATDRREQCFGRREERARATCRRARLKSVSLY